MQNRIRRKIKDYLIKNYLRKYNKRIRKRENVEEVRSDILKKLRKNLTIKNRSIKRFGFLGHNSK